MAINGTATSHPAALLDDPAAARETCWTPPDARRRLQLCLSAIWLLDAILQAQPSMFTGALARMIAATAAGNPSALADPILGAARLVGQYPAAANAGFAAIQLLLAAGIAWRPAVRAALAASVVWSIGVWWIGEGLGGVLAGTADPVSGAPGAVVIYAILAMLLWPADRGGASAPAVALRRFGPTSGRAIWLLLWAGLAYLALADRTPAAPHPSATGNQGWLAMAYRDLAHVLVQRGQVASVVLAALFTVIGAGIFARPAAIRVVLAVAMLVAAAIWVVGENFGGIFTGMGTDPNSGPLVALLAAAYWPCSPRPAGRAGSPLP